MGGGYKRKEKKKTMRDSGSMFAKKSPLTISPKIILTIITNWKKINNRYDKIMKMCYIKTKKRSDVRWN